MAQRNFFLQALGHSRAALVLLCLVACWPVRANVTVEVRGVDDQLPTTGLSAEWEQALSSPFVHNERYGTRSSTLVLLEYSGAVSVTERRFDPSGSTSADTEFSLQADEWP